MVIACLQYDINADAYQPDFPVPIAREAMSPYARLFEYENIDNPRRGNRQSQC